MIKINWTQARDLAVPILASFISFVITTIRPLSRTSQEYAFLYYTVLLLFFFPRNRLFGQLRTTVYGVFGSALGLAWANATLAIAAYCGRRYGADSDLSRAILGLGLATLALICGFSKSYWPHLVAASNIALFFPIFLLTAEQGITEVKPRHFLDQFLVTLFAAAAGLFATVLIPRPSCAPKLDALLSETVKTTSQLLPLSLASVLDPTSPSPPADALQQQTLAHELKTSLGELKICHREYRTECVRAPISPAALRPYIKALTQIHRNPLLGPTSHLPGARIKAAMDRTYERNSRPATPRDSRHSSSPSGSPSRDSPRPLKIVHRPLMGYLSAATQNVVKCISASLDLSLQEVRCSFGWSSEEGADLVEQKMILENAVGELQRRLSLMMDEFSVSPHPTNPRNPPLHYRDRWRVAFYLVALIDSAKDIDKLLDISMNIRSQSTKSRLHLPFIGSSHHPPPEPLSNDPLPDPAPIGEKHLEDMDFVSATLYHQNRASEAPHTMYGRFEHYWRQVWDQHSVLRVRVFVSHCIHHLKHSRHGQFALKMSVGVTLLSIPALLSPGSNGREWYHTSRGAWMVVSYMYVLEVHTGAILKIAVQRAVGTFLGSLAAFICTLIAQDNPYALVTLATACSVPITYVILFTRRPLIGVIVGITLPPLLFLSYLNLDEGLSHFTLAWTRFVDIIIGIAAAVIVGTTIWPNHARVRYLLAVSDTMEKATDYYLQMSRDLLRSSLVYQVNDQVYSKLERQVRASISISRSLIEIQKKEVSLLPRPIKLYSEVVEASDRLMEMLDEIRVLRFNVPRKSTVLDVLPVRRELVSAILTNLWALSQSFRSRSPLPQYLPSTRLPLNELVEAIDVHSHRSRSRSRHVSSTFDGNVSGVDHSDLGTLYSMAENEALVDLCNIIDQLIAAARTLFGSQTFWDHPGHVHVHQS